MGNTILFSIIVITVVTLILVALLLIIKAAVTPSLGIPKHCSVSPAIVNLTVNRDIQCLFHNLKILWVL